MPRTSRQFIILTGVGTWPTPPSRTAGRRRLAALSVCLSFGAFFPMVAHVAVQVSPVPTSVPPVLAQIPNIPVQVGGRRDGPAGLS